MDENPDLERKAQKMIESLTESDESRVPEPDIQKNSKERQLGGNKIPATWDPQELKFLTENRKKLSNQEMKEFFERDSKFHENYDRNDWEGFSRTEERYLIQNFKHKSAEEMAESLGRKEKEIKAKAHMMGLFIEDD